MHQIVDPPAAHFQVFVFTNTGQDIAAAALGATTALSSLFGTNYASYGNDLYADPINGVTLNTFVNSGCGGGGDTWSVSFPPVLPVYPLGYPMPVSSVVFVNRGDNAGNVSRPSAGAASTRGYSALVASLPTPPPLPRRPRRAGEPHRDGRRVPEPH